MNNLLSHVFKAFLISDRSLILKAVLVLELAKIVQVYQSLLLFEEKLR